MKHLKLYENVNNIIWVITKNSTLTPDDVEIFLFDDKKSAENYFITLVNDMAIEDNYEDKTKNYIFTLEDALNYNSDNYRFDLFYSKILGNFDLPEELKLGANTKKFNL